MSTSTSTIESPTRLDMFAGDSFNLDINVVDDTNAPINLTGASLFLSCKRQFTDSGYLFQAFTPSGITITDAVNGRASIAVPPSATSSIAFPAQVDRIVAHYDIELIQLDGTRTTLAHGHMVIHAAVTGAA